MTVKTLSFAFASLVLVSASARAGDLMDELASLDLDTINDSAADVEEFDLDSLDVDQLASNAGEASDTDAIEACFRRFGGYRGHGRGWGRWGGYRSYGYRTFRSCYSYYRPAYHCYRPIVRHCYPVFTSYWGCH